MATYRATVLKDAPLLYWRLGESGNTEAEDRSGNSRAGEYRNEATLGATGLLAGDSDAAALFSEAKNSYVKALSYNPFSGTKTFEIWAKRNATHEKEDVFFGSSEGGGSGVFAYIKEGTTNIRLTLNGFGTTATWEGVWPGDEQAVHVVFVVNTSTLKATLYVNGVSKGEKTISAYGATPGNVRISHDNGTGGIKGCFAGTLDEFAIYEGALSAERIAAHYAAGSVAPPAPSPACMWGADMDGDVALMEGEGKARGDAPYDSTTWNRFEEHAGRKVGIVHFSDKWNEAEGLVWDGFGKGASDAVWARGAIPLKSIGGPANVLADVVAGKYDASIKKWAEAAGKWRHPFLVRPWWEFNLSSSVWAWSGSERAAVYVEAWKRLHRLIAPRAPNATFAWCPNVIAGGLADPAPWYPGHDYVDWTGMDGYSGQNPAKSYGWRSAHKLFLGTYERLQAIAPNKPIVICEVATSEYGGSKPTWTRNLLGEGLQEEMPQVKALVWFNWNIEEGTPAGSRMDWPIESSEAAREAFKASIASTYYGDPDHTALRDRLKVRPLGTRPERVVVGMELPPDKLAVLVRNPATGEIGGRWAQDESNTENVFSGLTKSGEMPGGHKEMSCALARDPRLSFPDLDIYSDIEVQGPGGEVVWSGELRKKPATDGDRLLIEPAAVGHQAALEDNKAQIGPGFIDTDLSKWGEPSTQRKVDMLATNVLFSANVTQGSQESGEAPAAIQMDFSGAQSEPGKGVLGYSVYDAGGPSIAQVLYQLLVLHGPEGGGAWLDQVQTAIDDRFLSGYAASADLNATDSTGTLEAAQGSRYAALVSQYTEPGEAGVSMSDLHAWLPKVVGDHGLPLQGTWPEVGFYAKQMLLYAIPRFTELNATEESIEDDGFLITQAWFSLGSMGQLVNELTKYGLLDWFVFQDRLFQLRFPGTYGRKWQAYAGPSGLKATGQDGTRLWRDLMVKWRDVDGTTKTAGPPGSGAMFEDASLEITDPDHPAVKANKTRRDLLELRDVSTPTLAVKTAARFLEEANQLDHSGEATLSGYVQDDKGVWRPASQVQPGDQVRFPDAADRSYRKVTQPNYSDDSKAAQVTLDAPKEGLIALEERFAAKLRPLGLA